MNLGAGINSWEATTGSQLMEFGERNKSWNLGKGINHVVNEIVKVHSLPKKPIYILRNTLESDIL
jgi:hypothetical protein